MSQRTPTRNKTWWQRNIRPNSPFHYALSILALLASLAQIAINEVDWPRVWAWFSPLWAQTVAVVAIIVLSILLSILRARRPKVYATIEAFVGLTAGWLAFAPATSSSTAERFAKAFAAVYLLVRAGDNWNRGVEMKMALATQTGG